MRILLSHEFPVSASPLVVMEELRDVGAVVSCVPGARLGPHVNEAEYEATIVVSVEDVQVAFSGKITVSYDDEAGHATLFARGRDASGMTKARAELTLAVASRDDERETSSVVTVGGFVELVGALAGVAEVGGRVIADGLLRSFGSCLATRLTNQGVPR